MDASATDFTNQEKKMVQAPVLNNVECTEVGLLSYLQKDKLSLGHLRLHKKGKLYQLTLVILSHVGLTIHHIL